VYILGYFIIRLKGRVIEVGTHVITEDCASLILLSGDYVLSAVIHERIDAIRIFKLVRPVGKFRTVLKFVLTKYSHTVCHYNPQDPFIVELDCTDISPYLRSVPEVPLLSLRSPFLIGINQYAKIEDKSAIEVTAWLLSDLSVTAKRSKLAHLTETRLNYGSGLLEEYVKYMYYINDVECSKCSHVPCISMENQKIIFTNFSIRMQNNELVINQWDHMLIDEAPYRKVDTTLKTKVV
jgi:hypothetical protein